MQFKKATIKDILLLQNICIEAYSQSFASHWEAGGLAWYLEQQFGLKQLEQDLTGKAIGWYIMIEDITAVGFAKVKYNASLLPEITKATGIELEKLYLLSQHKGKGYGKIALQAIIQEAKDLHKKTLFLYVVDTNEAAIRFYQKVGFEFYNRYRLELPYFKDDLRGMWQMTLKL